jgi:Flp pilus assembly protein TadG
MKRTQRPRRGIAAVEFAILVPILVVLISAPLFIGRVLWHYTAAQKAAHDAARFLSTVSEGEMRTQGLAASSVAVARDIVAAELADLNNGSYPPSVFIQCDGLGCDGLVMPVTVRVTVRMEMMDPFFGISAGSEYGLLISADVQMSYIGSK